jgi:hypothetical protein
MKTVATKTCLVVVLQLNFLLEIRMQHLLHKEYRYRCVFNVN